MRTIEIALDIQDVGTVARVYTRRWFFLVKKQTFVCVRATKPFAAIWQDIKTGLNPDPQLESEINYAAQQAALAQGEPL